MEMEKTKLFICLYNFGKKEVMDLRVMILYSWTPVAIRLKLTVHLCNLGALSCPNSREPKQWKMLCCLLAFWNTPCTFEPDAFHTARFEVATASPTLPCDCTWCHISRKPSSSILSLLFGFLFLSYVCQHLSSPTSLIPPSLRCISTELLCTVGFPWQPQPTCSRSAKSRGIQCSSPLLATPPALLGSDWLACLQG